MLTILIRRVLGFLNGSVEPGLSAASESASGELAVDAARALWVRDYQGQPAQTWTPITPSDSAALPSFRALRFDTAGTVKLDLVTSSGASSGVTRNVAAGEVWSATSAAITRIYTTGTTATGIDGLG